MNTNTIRQIAETAKKHLADYDMVGVRVQEKVWTAKIGSTITHKSHNWEDGKKLRSLVNGVCAIDVTRAHKLDDYGGYDGDYAIILGSNWAEGGNDIAEVIMDEAVVLEIVKL